MLKCPCLKVQGKLWPKSKRGWRLSDISEVLKGRCYNTWHTNRTKPLCPPPLWNVIDSSGNISSAETDWVHSNWTCHPPHNTNNFDRKLIFTNSTQNAKTINLGFWSFAALAVFSSNVLGGVRICMIDLDNENITNLTENTFNIRMVKI